MVNSMKNDNELEKELENFGLIARAREIHSEFGDSAALSYLRSSYRLLSKVYHPDMNPGMRESAKIKQQRLNRVNRLIHQMKDQEIIEIIRKGAPKEDKRKILLVEDDNEVLNLIKEIFLLEGYDVRCAVDGVTGYEVFLKFKPDLVLTDVVMPNMSGVELAGKIREKNPRVRVVYISGFLGADRIKRKLDRETLRYGYRAISKPFEINKMTEMVNDYIKDNRDEERTISFFA
ncbi:MAG: response regulator [Deltaproteobacteria bacterium]|nr:response regulator [Deltaproteobacteria bacterium]